MLDQHWEILRERFLCLISEFTIFFVALGKTILNLCLLSVIWVWFVVWLLQFFQLHVSNYKNTIRFAVLFYAFKWFITTTTRTICKSPMETTGDFASWDLQSTMAGCPFSLSRYCVGIFCSNMLDLHRTPWGLKWGKAWELQLLISTALLLSVASCKWIMH